jgi:two-component system response regulator LytT
MKVVIIEDEPLTARDLAACIVAAEPSAEIVAMLSSVAEATGFFKTHAAPDIIFSDIQLGDGLSFSIFEACAQVVPVIFCTAYDEYALDAFRAAGIDYILKPFTAASIAAALGKYNAFRSRWTGTAPSYSGLAGIFGASGAATPGALGSAGGGA